MSVREEPSLKMRRLVQRDTIANQQLLFLLHVHPGLSMQIRQARTVALARSVHPLTIVQLKELSHQQRCVLQAISVLRDRLRLVHPLDFALRDSDVLLAQQLLFLAMVKLRQLIIKIRGVKQFARPVQKDTGVLIPLSLNVHREMSKNLITVQPPPERRFLAKMATSTRDQEQTLLLTARLVHQVVSAQLRIKMVRSTRNWKPVPLGLSAQVRLRLQSNVLKDTTVQLGQMSHSHVFQANIVELRV